MRIWEALLVIHISALLVIRSFPHLFRKRWIKILLICGMGVTLIPHLLLEKYRWQMLPAYLLGALLLLDAGVRSTRWPAYLPSSTARRPKPLSAQSRKGALHAAIGRISVRAGKTIVKIAAGLLLVLSIALPLSVPVFVLPSPGGPYAIGTTSMVFTDPEPPETMTPQPDDTRRLLIHFWYPAEPSPDQSPTNYWTRKQARRFSPPIGRSNFSFFPFPPSPPLQDEQP